LNFPPSPNLLILAKKPKTLKGRWLGTIYQKANQELSLASGEAADKYKQEVSEILQKLEAGDKELAKIWGKTRKWCLDDFEKFYKELGVSFDNYFFDGFKDDDATAPIRFL